MNQWLSISQHQSVTSVSLCTRHVEKGEFLLFKNEIAFLSRVRVVDTLRQRTRHCNLDFSTKSTGVIWFTCGSRSDRNKSCSISLWQFDWPANTLIWFGVSQLCIVITHRMGLKTASKTIIKQCLFTIYMGKPVGSCLGHG